MYWDNLSKLHALGSEEKIPLHILLEFDNSLTFLLSSSNLCRTTHLFGSRGILFFLSYQFLGEVVAGFDLVRCLGASDISLLNSLLYIHLAKLLFKAMKVHIWVFWVVRLCFLAWVATPGHEPAMHGLCRGDRWGKLLECLLRSLLNNYTFNIYHNNC